ncbi:DUF5994 family protein [Actinosynnema sp. CS-041913]|uniref:DUF5994 family protein n=1 Tax=Actinosynnema sp. CS-041913 TaxID=3239917 RepID=UPI003D940657
MTSDLLTGTPDPTAERLRFALRPDGAPHGHVDGGWWPRSTDPVAEFPALITALASRGPIRRVSYHLGVWGPAGRRLTVAGVDVRMEGFHTPQPDIVTLIGPHLTRTVLLVVPPGTAGGAARAVLRAAADQGTTASVAEILEGNGVPVSLGAVGG